MEMPEKITLFGGSCNTYFIDDGIKVLIDAGYDFQGEVDVVVLTHGHPDHTKYLKQIMERNPECEVFINLNDVPLLVSQSFEINDRFKSLQEGDVVETGKYNLEVIEVPAHTKGSVVLYDKENKILFCGDTVFKDGVGRTDFPESVPEFMDTAINLIIGLDVEKFFPGHGEPFTYEDFEKIL